MGVCVIPRSRVERPWQQLPTPKKNPTKKRSHLKKKHKIPGKKFCTFYDGSLFPSPSQASKKEREETSEKERNPNSQRHFTRNAPDRRRSISRKKKERLSNTHTNTSTKKPKHRKRNPTVIHSHSLYPALSPPKKSKKPIIQTHISSLDYERVINFFWFVFHYSKMS